jgi:hypothetical protein
MKDWAGCGLKIRFGSNIGRKENPQKKSLGRDQTLGNADVADFVGCMKCETEKVMWHACMLRELL